MKIAVCDDMKRDLLQLRTILTRISESSSIDIFESGESFLSAAAECKYDLVFMDIYLRGENGIDVIRRLRLRWPETAVVFTTMSDSHAVDAFSVQAIHYLVKPYSVEAVEEAVNRAKRWHDSALPVSTLTVRISNDIYNLAQCDIVRVESSDHKTNIFMRSGTVYSIWMSFSKVEELLDESFLNINRGICVNMLHVVRWRAQDCEMVDGAIYLLNRRKRQTLKDTYLSFMMEKLEEKSDMSTVQEFEKG